MKALLAKLALVCLLLCAPFYAGAQRPEIVTQSGHAYPVLSTAFSPDGRLVASGDDVGAVKLWETQTGRLLRTINAHKGRVSRLAFSACGDALASESKSGNSNEELYADESLRLWNVRTGKMLLELNVAPFAFSPDGKLFAAGEGLKINLWDASDGRLLRTLAGHAHPVGTLAFTPDGKLLGSSGDPLADMPAEEEETKTDDAGKDGAAVKGRLARKESAGAVPDGAHLWDVKTGRPELELKGCAQVHFNADASLAADSAGNVCETKTGALLHKSDGKFVAFSPDGGALALLTYRGAPPEKIPIYRTATALDVLDARTGKPLHVFDALKSADRFAFSPDGQWIAFSYFEDKESHLEVWDARRWQKAWGLRNYDFDAFSPDGKQLTAARHDGEKNLTMMLVEARSGKTLASLAGYEYASQPTLFSPDGRVVLARDDEALRLFDVPGGVVRQVFQGIGEGAIALVFSPNGRSLAIARLAAYRANMSYDVWDTRSGALAHSYASLPLSEKETETKSYDEREIAFSSDGQLLKTGDGQVRDVRSGTLARRFEGASAIGEKVYAVVNGASVELHNAESGALIRRINAPEAFALALSPDGKMLAIGFGLGVGLDAPHMKLYDAATGRVLHAFTDVSDLARRIRFSDDSRLVAVTFGSGSARFVDNLIFDTRTGRMLADDSGKKPEAAGAEQGEGGAEEYQGTESTRMFLAFSPDNKRYAIQGQEDGTVELRDARTDKLVQLISGVVPNADGADFSPDGKILVTADGDTALRFWRTESGELLATALSLPGGDWLALTPDGLFDGSPAAWSKILWRFSEDTFNVAPAEIFFNEFYHPGLLGEIFDGAWPRASQSIADKDRRQPRVAVELTDKQSASGASVETRNVTLRLTVAEDAPDSTHAKGSGAQDVRLFRNGSLVKAWRGDVLEGRSGATLEATVPIVAGENRFTAYAFNRDNVKSVDSALTVKGADSLKRKGTAYVVAFGVNEYANAQYNLRYAVADAQVFADEWRRQQESLKGYERVETTLLFDHEATKANMLAALARLAEKTQPEDAVVVYFAGHGTAFHDQFYLLPHDLGYAGGRERLDKDAIETILAHSVSDRELEGAFEKINAAQILFVIDACNSGQALEAEEKRRGPMNSKGLAQLAYEKGMYVLTAAQSFEAAQEAAQVGHGLLTYALVEEGLKKSAADTEPKDGEVRVREWLDYATRRVPEMQIAEMKRALARGIKLSFADEERALSISNRSGQRPRVFYRRELESQPLVVARPAAPTNDRPKTPTGQRAAPVKASPKTRAKRVGR